jgi:hypothetical protein
MTQAQRGARALEACTNRSLLLPILRVVAGVLMLLPGGCVIVVVSLFGLPARNGVQVDVEFWYFLWFVCFAISTLGVYLRVQAFR